MARAVDTGCCGDGAGSSNGCFGGGVCIGCCSGDGSAVGRLLCAHGRGMWAVAWWATAGADTGGDGRTADGRQPDAASWKALSRSGGDGSISPPSARTLGTRARATSCGEGIGGDPCLDGADFGSGSPGGVMPLDPCWRRRWDPHEVSSCGVGNRGDSGLPELEIDIDMEID